MNKNKIKTTQKNYLKSLYRFYKEERTRRIVTRIEKNFFEKWKNK